MRKMIMIVAVKNKIIITLFFVFGIGYAQQEHPQAASIGGGYERNGYFVRGAYSKVYGNHLFRSAGQIHKQQFEIPNTDKNQTALLYVLNLEYYHQVFALNGKDFLVYAGAGGIGGYENTNTITLQNNGRITGGNEIIYGGHLGVEIQKYLMQLNAIGSSLGLVVNVRQNYVLGSVLGNTFFNASLGVKLNF